MSRFVLRGRARWGRALASMLLAIGGLAACGPEQPDASATVSAAVASAIPPGKAECRRWTTCVPENPCHTGWVTGCRKNEPICTDIGGWLSNGTACGTDAVCYMGECAPCAAGQSCPIYDRYGYPDPCRAGAIACATGQPVCLEQGPAPDGTACGGGGPYVCKGGSCTWCMDGWACTPPEKPCHQGTMTACATTGGTCVDNGAFQPNGSWCGNGGELVCRDGECVTCPLGACQPEGMPCYEGNISCSSGWPVCSASWPKPDGTPCGGGFCQGGQCMAPCVPDQPCTPWDACRSGRTVCWGPSNTYCEPRDPLPDGTSCGAGMVCSNASCVPCGAGAWCPSPTPCYGSGAISCTTGRCEPQPPPYGDGLACGVGGETCQGGTCTPAPGADPWVRSTYGAVDLAGTTWFACMSNEPDPGKSRLRVDTYLAAGAVTHGEAAFTSSLDCSGPTDPAGAFTIAGTIVSAGDRLASWANGYVPPGLPWSPTATAMQVTAPTSPQGPVAFNELVFVHDAVSPRQMFRGESKNPDVFPSTLEGTMPMTEVLACSAGQPCTPGFTTCEVFQIDCSIGAPVCAGTGTFLADGTRCADGHSWCQAGACVPVPTRTVTGTSLMTYWPDTGAVSTTDPSAVQWVAALQFGGGFAVHPGTLYPDGSFAIPGVEVGAYQLEVGLAWLRYYGNTADTVELGADALGRRDLAWATGPTPVWFDLKGLVPWARGDVLELASSNAGVAALPFGGQESTAVPEGLEQLTGSFDWNGRPLVSGAAGDVAYLFHGATTLAPTGERITAASRFAQLPPTFELLDVVGGTVDVTLEPCTGSGSVSADWRRAAFEAYAPAVHPAAAALNHRIVLSARPHESPLAPGFRAGELAQYKGLPLLVVQASAPAGDATLAGVAYGRFLPPLWSEYRHDRVMFGVSFLAPGATASARLTAPLGYDVAAARAPAVVAPLLAPPGGLKIAGLDAWSGVAGVGTQPRISWTAPVVSPEAAAVFPGAALQYRVTVREVRLGTGGTTQLVALFEGNTTRTSFTLPGTSMYFGGRYVVSVEARLTTDSPTAPLHASVETAYATVVSGEFTP